MKNLVKWLDQNITSKSYLFSLHDLRALYPNLSNSTFKALISRAASAGYLDRLCRGIYLYRRAMNYDGLMLFHIAAHLRAIE